MMMVVGQAKIDWVTNMVTVARSAPDRGTATPYIFHIDQQLQLQHLRGSTAQLFLIESFNLENCCFLSLALSLSLVTHLYYVSCLDICCGHNVYTCPKVCLRQPRG